MRGVIEGLRAKKYSREINPNVLRPFSKFILDNIIVKDSKICDLCCGSGVSIEVMPRDFKEAVLVDASKDMIEICKKKFSSDKRISCVIASATDTGLKNSHFDYIILRMGMHHISDKQKLFDEINRISSKDCKIIIIDKFLVNPFRYNLLKFFNFFFRFNQDYLDHFLLSQKKTFEIIENNFNVLTKEILHVKKDKNICQFMIVLEKKLDKLK